MRSTAFKCLHTKPAGSDRTACLAQRRPALQHQGRQARDRATPSSAASSSPPAAATRRSSGRAHAEHGRPRLLAPAAQCFGLDLSSPDVILGCLQISSPARRSARSASASRASAISSALSPPTRATAAPVPARTAGATGGLAGLPVASQTVRCQRAVATSGRKLLSRQLSVARSCVDSLLKCRLSGKPRDACQKVATGCGRKLAALDDPTSGARAKMLGAIQTACGPLPERRAARGERHRLRRHRRALRRRSASDPRRTSTRSRRASPAPTAAPDRTSCARRCRWSTHELARVGLSLGNECLLRAADADRDRDADRHCDGDTNAIPTRRPTRDPDALEPTPHGHRHARPPPPPRRRRVGTAAPATATPTPSEPAHPHPHRRPRAARTASSMLASSAISATTSRATVVIRAAASSCSCPAAGLRARTASPSGR